jgi:choline kinase
VRAVILAAGRGGRLRGVVGNKPKCLARVGNSSLLERQIRLLREAGLDRVTVITGFRADAVRRVCGPGVDVVHNARFADTDSLYSLWLARERLADGFVVLNCDVLFPSRLLTDLLDARYDDALLVCARGDQPDYSDEEMKVCIRHGLVKAIDKALSPDKADGENIGIAKFGAPGAALLVDELEALVAAGAVAACLPRAFASFCRRRPLHVVESGGYPWIEIDFPEDYWRACSEVLPAIDLVDTSRPGRTRAIPRTTERAASGHATTVPAGAARAGRTFRHV